jgi:hypothetical protein
MADAVTTRILANGARNLVMRFTNFSDGTGESAVTKVDATDAALGYKGVAPGTNLRVKVVDFSIRSGGLRILWDATTDEDALVLDGQGNFKFNPLIRCPAIAGATGILRFTTVGFAINSGYDVTLHMIKGVPQS